MCANRWILAFFAVVLAAVLLLSGLAYAVDPYLQFRVRDNTYLLSARFADPGLIRNYDYDTLIVGSSMTQNFNMDLFRSELGCRPLHASLGGLTAPETGELVQAAYRAGKAGTYYICVDLSFFTDDPQESQFPGYLFREDLLSRFRYLLGYELWFRYIPADLALMAADRLGVELPQKFAYSRSIDLLENWSLDEPCGEEIFLNNAWLAPIPDRELDHEGIDRGMTEHIDAFLAQFDFARGEHVFFFPPYSGLFWYNAQFTQYYDHYLRAKLYFIRRAEALGAQVYDFQSAEFTSDLSVYRDELHYGPEINDWMVRCFASGDYRATPENASELQAPIERNTERFAARFATVYAP